MKYATLLRPITVMISLLISSIVFSQTSPLNIGIVPPGKSVVAVYDVVVNSGTSVINQASLGGTNFGTFLSNDPKTAAPNDATTTSVTAVSATQYYVDDNSDANDVYTPGATGNDANAGTAAAPFRTIAHALSVAPAGSTIFVDAGEFIEQVVINKSITITGAASSGVSQTTIKAPATLAAVTTTSSNKAVVFASGAGNTINISKVVVDGDGRGGGPEGFEGVYYFEASGSFSQSGIIKIRDAAYSGNQSGIAFFANHNYDVSVVQTVTVDNNTITDYQKAGIVINELNTHGIVTNNTVTGQNTPHINGENGIQFGFGAYGTITGNTVTNNIYNGPSTDVAAGILVVGVGVDQNNTPTGTTTTIGGNTINGNEAGLYIDAGGSGYDSHAGVIENVNTYSNNDIHVYFSAPPQVPNAANNYDKRVDNPAQTYAVYGKIQRAVDYATAGDVLNASAGTFTEQVEIPKTVTLNGQGTGITTILSPNVLALSYTTTGLNKAIVFVHDAAGVVIKNLTVNGAGKGNVNSRFQGIAYWNAGGTVQDCEVKGIRNNPIDGVQGGVGIYGYASNGTARTLLVKHNTITDFQKNATTFAGANLTVTVDNNTITGAGPVNFIAQNGVQISSGATGSIINNIISAFSYTLDNSASSAGILVFGAGGSVLTTGNTVNDAQVAIYYYQANGSITDNTISYTAANMGSTSYWYGIDADLGTTTVSRNEIHGGGNGAGIEADAYDGEATSITAENNSVDNTDEAFVIFTDGTGSATQVIHNNSITNSVSKAIHNYGTTNADATCNWYGTTNSAIIATKIEGPVTYIPYLTNGTDNDAITHGFQPVPNSCTGPIARTDYYVDDNNDAGDVYTPGAIGSDVTGDGSPSAPFATITKALSVAVAGNTIYVDAGAYDEAANVNTSVIIKGARAGSDARTRGAVSESVMKNSAGAFGVNADNVVIDGFTIQDQTNANAAPTFGYAVYMAPGHTGTQLLNSIIRNNIVGSSLANTGASQMLIKKNWFDNNNQAGPASGAGIYTDEFTGGGVVSNVLIDSNKFSNQTDAGIDFSTTDPTKALTGITISNNQFDANYRAIFLYNTVSSTFKNNEVSNSTGAGSGEVRIYGGVNDFSILNNKFSNGAPNGVRITDDGSGSSTSNITVHENSFTSAPPALAIQVASGYTGTLDGTCNWYGSSDPAVVASKIEGPVTYIPFLTNGTDSDPAMPGFQPVAGACNGPVTELYVNDDSRTGDHYTSAIGNDANPGTSSAPFRTIQHAVDVASAGNTIWVDAGTYREDVTIDKQLTIHGSNYNINPNTSSRIAETIVQPETSNPDPNTGTAILDMDLAASGTTIDGFTIDGDNTTKTSNVTSNGSDIDAIDGIAAYSGIANSVVKNNIIKNLSYTGVDYFNTSTTTAGNTIADNKFDNIVLPSAGGIFFYNTYTQVTTNVMTRVGVGVQTENFYTPDPGSNHSISNNTISSTRKGIWHNNIYANASAFDITNNTITTDAGATKNDGIEISSIQTSVGVNILNNNITGARAGYDLWNCPTTNTVTINGGTLTNCKVGVFANNYDGYNTNADPSSYAITGITTNNCDTAVWVRDNVQNSNNATVVLNINNTNTINGTGIGVLIEGKDASVILSGAAPVNFSTSLSKYFRYITNGTDVPAGNINATGAQFGGANGAAMTDVQLYAIEDKIDHKIDWSPLGFVLVKAANDYVTPNSFYTPNTTEAKVQRGVDASSNGFTVNIANGSYRDSVLVNKEVTITGQSQAGAIVYPATSNPVGSGGTLGGSNIFTVKANNVTINNLTADGDNPANGAGVDARTGIVTDFNSGDFTNLTVHHTTVKNIYYRGIYSAFGNTVGQTFNFHHNTVSNVKGDPSSVAIFNYANTGIIDNNTVSDASDAIAANQSTGTVFSNNTVTTSGSGIHTDNNGGSGGAADMIKNNTITNSTAGGLGIMVFIPSLIVTVQENTITNVDTALVNAGQDAAVITLFQRNTVDGMNKPGSKGVYQTTGTFGVAGSTNVSGNYINNYITNNDDGFYPEYEAGHTNTITVNNNSITGNTPGVTLPVGAGSAGTLVNNFECNWWGSSNAAAVAAAVGAPVDYTPYLTNGTDNAPATPGFQPVPGSCSGLNGDSDGDGVPDAEDCAPTDPNSTNKKPKLTATINNVTIVSNNDGVDDEGAFSVANATNNIVFGPFTDQNGNTGPVRAYQTLALTNATTTMCGNCSALLTEFNGGVHSLTLIDPYTAGKLVMTYRTWIDDNNNRMIDPGECVSPDRVIYTITINAAPRTDFYVNDDVQGGDHYTTAIGNDATGTGSPSAPYRTITKALSVASAGNTIWVDAGSYKEEANINKSVTVKGSNAGTAGNAVRLAESVVDGENATHAGFLVNANNITVDGFEVTGGGGASYNSGVWFNATQSGVHLINNIITDNVIGVYAQSNGTSFIKHNLLDGNNRPGAAGGAAIYTEFSNGLTIDSNEIKNHLNNSAVVFAANSASAHQNVVFTQNYLHNNNADNSMVYCVGVNTGNFNKNTITQPGTTAIKFAGACTSITVSNNFLDNNGTGVKTADDLYGFGANSAIQVHENSFTGNTVFAINNLETTHTINATCNWYGTTDASVIATKVNGNVTYTPYLNNGTDNDGATPGFQPVPGSCINNPCDNDNTPPTIVSKDATIHTDGNGNAHVNPFDVIQSVTDNCKVDSATIMVSPSDFTCATPPSTDGVHQAYVAPTSQGVQDYGGELGMEFSVNEPAGITISQLGAFDDKSDGLHGTQSGGGIRVGIFSKATQQLVAGLSAVVVTTDPLVNNYRFVNVAPVTLPVGDYVIVAKGYNANERNGNKYYGSPVATGDLDGGAISYIGTSRYGNDDPGTFGYPTHADFGPANQYLAGTFSYSKASGGGGGGGSNTHTVTITAKDAHGNMATATATVTVVCDGTGGDPCTNDQTPPTIVSKNATIHADGNGNASVQPSDVVQSFTDNCGVDNASLMVSPNQFTCSTGSGDGNHQAYVAPTNQGIQNYGGELGMEFRVNEPNGITISQLGAFDDKGDGLHGTQSGGGIRVGIFNKSTQQLVTGLDVTIVSADPYVSNYRFKNVAPVTLPPGDYVIVAKGYSDNERNGNKFNGSPVANGDLDGGAISYIGTSRYGSDANAAAFDYPTHPDYGPANQYLAGTFSYSKAGSGGGSNTHIVTITGKDTHGNMATTTATVTVICDGSGNPCDNDHTPPTLITKNITINADGNGNATIVPDDVIASLTDDCGVDNASKTVTPNQFTCSSGTGSSDGVHQAYVATTNQGKQGDYTGELGMDFIVNNPGGITISQLGAFDDNGDGINGTQSGGIRVAVFNKTTQQLVAGLNVLIVTSDPYVNNYRFKTLASPVTIPAGDYVIVAKGYNVNERNGNLLYGSPTAIGDLDAGAISYTGTSRYGDDNIATFGFPTHPDHGSANQYLAGTFVYTKAGGGGNTHTVTVTAKDVHGNLASATATVTVVCNQASTTIVAEKGVPATGDVEVNSSDVQLYPNPTKGRFNVRLYNLTAAKVTLQILTETGVQVTQKVVELSGRTASLMVPFDLSNKPAGMYLIRIISDQGTQIKKVILER